MEKVIVGTSKDKLIENERRSLVEKLKINGVLVERVPCLWPRDCFVNFNGKIYSQDKQGFYGDGGYIVTNPKFTLACSRVNEDYNGIVINSPPARMNKLESLYGGEFSLLPAPNIKLNTSMSPHIDLVVLPIPEKNVLFVDAQYNKDNPCDIKRVCDKYNLRRIVISQDYSNPTWPCNSLVLREKELAIATNSDNVTMIGELKKLRIKIIDVPYSENCRIGGSINCSTNTVPLNFQDLEKILF